MTIPQSTVGWHQSPGRGDFQGTPASPRVSIRILAALFTMGILTCDWLAPANQAPQAVGGIADQEVQVDSMVAVDVAGYFTDPDGDSLRYAARSSDLNLATVVVAGGTVVLTGVAAGSATVTVTATDPEGLSAQQSYGVTVPNRTPWAVGTIEDLEVEVDSAVVVGIAGYFADPDGDELGYAAASSDSTRATLAVTGDTVTVVGVAKGSVVVTVTATDVEGLSAEQSFGVTVPNRTPVAVGIVPDLAVEVDSVAVVEFAGYFADPDGDELELTAVSSDTTRAGVVVVGDTVTVGGVAKGSATVTVTATDTEGLSAEQSFGVTVPNRAPATVGTIADVEVEVDSAVAVVIAGHFADPDGDALEYEAVSSDSGRATLGVVGDTVTVTGVGKGSLTVTVTATDPEGLSVEQVFGVTVPNRAPVTVGTIVDLEVEVDSVVVVEVAAYFTDPDGDVLAYSAVSSDATKASIALTGSTATVTGVAKGGVTVTLVAQDPEGLSAQQHFGVRVPNRAPEAVGTIADLEVEVDSAAAVAVAGYYADPDGDMLEYLVESSDPARATVALNGSIVTVAGVAKGRVTVTVGARDPEGLLAQQHFAVTVPNRAPGAVGTIADLEVWADSAVAVDVAAYFADPDGDVLVYAAESSDASRAAVAVAGSTVTVTGVGKGSLTVTVTATDPEGLSVEQVFGVTVPNRAPVTVGTIVDLEVEVDSVVVVEVAAYFTDPDGDVLAYSAVSSDATKASIALTGSTATVTGVAKGGVTVTLVAQDPEGLSAQQHFGVRVPNRAPEAVGTIADLEVEVDSAAAVAVAGYYADPDGDMLEYLVESSDPARATVALNGSIVTVAGVAKGRVTVTVGARDPEGLLAQQHFAVTVPNRAPGAVGTIADLEVWADSAVAVDVAAYFADPDGDVLVYAAESSDASRAAVAVAGSTVTVTGVGKGNAAVTVTATDPEGLSAQQSFAVTVPNRAPDAVGSIRNRVVARGNTITVDASSHFADPDGDELVFSATSSRTRIATVSVSGDAVVVTGRAVGTTTITVTAHDSAGLAAEQRFDVTVPQPNRPPRASGTISDRSAAVNTEVSVDVSPNFTDPDGDPLTYSATSSNTSVATVGTSNSTVTITAESAGRSTITVTASDPDSLQATQSFRITVRRTNRAPLAVGTIPDRVATVGGAVSVNVPRYFTDPDGDHLEYTATSSNTSVATVGTSDTTVTVTGEALGTATITVTARDPSDRTATQRFTATVRSTNEAPETAGSIPGQTVDEGGAIEIDVEHYFSDPDGDDLDYAATSSRQDIASVDVSGSTVQIEGQQPGKASIEVTAEDPGGLTATQRYEVTVEESPNRAPVVSGPIIDLLDAVPGGEYVAALTHVFTDPDGDPLTYTASSTNTAVAEPEIRNDSILFVATHAVGSATITLTATDPEGLSATDESDVTVVADRFNIALGLTGNVKETQVARIRAAGNGWESTLRDTELEDVAMRDEFSCLDITVTSQLIPYVDDHLVLVDVRPHDGPGGALAFAGYCYTRASDGTPVVSAVVLDAADIDSVANLGGLDMLAFHLIGHGLGFLSTYWEVKGLLDDGDDPHFTGALAIEAFDAAGGTSYPGAKVPISSPGHNHWRDSIFGSEGMTSSLALGATNPFSAITLQAMADIGYVVDASRADDYQLPDAVPPDLTADAAGQVFDLANDVVREPVMVLDTDGNTVRVIPVPPGTIVPSWPGRGAQVERVEVRSGPGRETRWRRVTRPASSGRSR